MAAESVAPSAQSTTRLFVGVVIAGFCAFLGLYSTQPLLSLFREVFGASEAAVSLTISAATLAVALASPFVGLLADAAGRKRIMVPCLFVIAIPTCMGATAHSLHELIVWLGHRAGAMIAAGTIAGGVLIVLGLAVASSGVFIAQAAAASHVGHVAKGSRSAATGLYVAVYYLGGSVGATALSYPWRHGGWLAVVATLLVAQAISAMLAWRFFSRGHHEAETPDPATVSA